MFSSLEKRWREMKRHRWKTSDLANDQDMTDTAEGIAQHLLVGSRTCCKSWTYVDQSLSGQLQQR